MNKNLAIRTTVAAVAIPIILWICYQGGLWLWAMVTILSLVALWEFLVAEGYRSKPVALFLLLASGLTHMLLVAGPSLWNIVSQFLPDGFGAGSFGLSAPEILFLIIGSLFSIGRRPATELFQSFLRLFWGMFYLFGLYPFVIEVGNTFSEGPTSIRVGGDWLLFLFGLLWLGDTAAMFIGKAFGKHKLAPAVSPNKTVEGFVVGILGAVVVAVILGFWRLDMVPLWQLILISIACSVFGQLGDLVESMWKRSLNLKDSSSIIPGHGGVLDRFDSLLFAAPVMYYALSLIGR